MEAFGNLNITSDEIDEQFWKTPTSYVQITMVLVTLLGWIGNFLCYKTAYFMPEPSNGTVLLKYLAAWDSIYLLFHVSFVFDLQNIARFVHTTNVRLCLTGFVLSEFLIIQSKNRIFPVTWKLFLILERVLA